MNNKYFFLFFYLHNYDCFIFDAVATVDFTRLWFIEKKSFDNLFKSASKRNYHNDNTFLFIILVIDMHVCVYKCTCIHAYFL